MRAFPFFCVWLFVASVVRAQSPAPPLADEHSRVILFVGNSFTYGGSTPVHGYNAKAVIDENADQEPMGGIPGIFKKLADETGRSYEVHIELVGGKDLEYHYTHSLSVIASGKWDVVVLQGYSTEALPEKRGGKRANFIKYAGLLTKAIHDANRKTKIYLYGTWPRADLVYPEGAPYHGSDIGMMAHDLRTGYQTAENDGAIAIPVGDDWLLAIRWGIAQADPYLPPEPGKLNLWDKDYYHPSIYGSYLAALSLFGEIAFIDVRAMNPQEQAARDLGISTEDAAKLRRLAPQIIGGELHPFPDNNRRPD